MNPDSIPSRSLRVLSSDPLSDTSLAGFPWDNKSHSMSLCTAGPGSWAPVTSLQKRALPCLAVQNSQNAVGPAVHKLFMKEVRTPCVVGCAQFHLRLVGDLEELSAIQVQLEAFFAPDHPHRHQMHSKKQNVDSSEPIAVMLIREAQDFLSNRIWLRPRLVPLKYCGSSATAGVHL